MTSSDEAWAATVDTDLETLQERLAERRGQRARQLEEAVQRVRSDLAEVQDVHEETAMIEQRLRVKRRRRSNRQPGGETWERLDREIRELEQERRKLQRWYADRRREIRRELEEVRHELEDAEFSAEVLEGLQEHIVG